MPRSFIFFLMLLGSFLGAGGMFFVKKAAQARKLWEMLQRMDLWIGLVLNGLSVIAYMLVLRQVELSVAYPFASLTYIWTTWFSVKYLGEKMNSRKWWGLAGIIFGVSLIGIGG